MVSTSWICGARRHYTDQKACWKQRVWDNDKVSSCDLTHNRRRFCSFSYGGGDTGGHRCNQGAHG